jgi:malate synthase
MGGALEDGSHRQAVWEKVGEDNQMARKFPPLTYTQADADGLTLLEPAPRTVRGARDLLSVALQYGNAFGVGMQAAALKPADYFGNDDVLYLMEDMATGEIRLSILWEWLHKKAALTADDPQVGVKAGDVFTRIFANDCLRRSTKNFSRRAIAMFTIHRRRPPCRSLGRLSKPM